VGGGGVSKQWQTHSLGWMGGSHFPPTHPLLLRNVHSSTVVLATFIKSYHVHSTSTSDFN
jgi:hypothetical protein